MKTIGPVGRVWCGVVILCSDGHDCGRASEGDAGKAGAGGRLRVIVDGGCWLLEVG
jgi:hypothetical protein